jgi:ATP synthase regulation protein NCA2
VRSQALPLTASTRSNVLAATQTFFDAVCEELRSSEHDLWHWRRAAAAAGATGLLTQGLARMLGRRQPATSLGRADDVYMERMHVIRDSQQQLLTALAALQRELSPAAQALLVTPSDGLLHAASLGVVDAARAVCDVALRLAGRTHEVGQPRSAETAAQLLCSLADAVDVERGHGYPVGCIPVRCRRPPAWMAALPRAMLVLAGSMATARWLISAVRSGDLARWSRGARASIEDAYNAHVATPLNAVYKELFSTFRSRPGGVVTDRAMAASQESLRRQLADFAAAHGGSGGAAEDMEVLMRTYEKDAKKPVYGMLFGDLAWAMLVQIQKLKTDGEAAMMTMDQTLRANELTLSLVAALPGMAIVAGVLSALGTLFRRRPPIAPAHATAALRCHLEAATRALSIAEAMPQDSGSLAQHGRVLLALDGVHAAAAALLSPDTNAGPAAAAMQRQRLQVAETAVAGGAIRAVERQMEAWDAFQADVLFLGRADVHVASRLRAAERLMARTQGLLR